MDGPLIVFVAAHSRRQKSMGNHITEEASVGVPNGDGVSLLVKSNATILTTFRCIANDCVHHAVRHLAREREREREREFGV